MKRIAAVHAMLLLLLAGCVEKSRELTASERAQVKSYIGNQAPAPETPLDISFEDKVRLLGYDATAKEWKPGETITVTWYWKCEKALEDGWRLFTHIAEASGADRLNQDSEGVIRRLYQPGRWKKGEYIKDTQEMTLPDDWDSSRAIIYLGLWNGPHRLHVTKGPHDGEDRARALTIPTPGAKEAPAAAATPTLRAIKAAEAISIDGKLSEAAWKSAKPTHAFVNTMNGSPAPFRTTARATWNDEHLYIAFEVADDFLKSEFDEQDEHLWKQDAVEIMVDPDGDGRNYFEMQVSPNGISFDTRYDSRRVPQPIGHADWDSNLQAKVDVRGTVNDDDADQGYTAEIAIPWSAFAAGTPPASKPAANASWRVNFYVMDTRADGSQRAAGWSPPRVGDFHVPNRFGRVLFVDPSAPAAAAPAPTGSATATAGAKLQVPQGVMKQIRRSLTAPGVKRDPTVNRPRPGEPVPSPDNPNPAATKK